MFLYFFFFFKQKTAYEMRISDWSSDVCSSDLDLVQFEGMRLSLHVLQARLGEFAGPLGAFECAVRALDGGVVFGCRGVQRGVAIPEGGGEADQIGRASCRERVCKYV